MLDAMFSITVLLVLVLIVILSKVRKPIKVAILITSVLSGLWSLSYIARFIFDEMSFFPTLSVLFSIVFGWPLSSFMLKNIQNGDSLALLIILGAICGIIQCSILGYVVAWVLVKTKVWKI